MRPSRHSTSLTMRSSTPRGGELDSTWPASCAPPSTVRGGRGEGAPREDQRMGAALPVAVRLLQPDRNLAPPDGRPAVRSMPQTPGAACMTPERRGGVVHMAVKEVLDDCS